MNNQLLLDCAIEISELLKCNVDIPCFTLKELDVGDKCLIHLHNKKDTSSNDKLFNIHKRIEELYVKYKQLPSTLITEYILCATQLSTHLWNQNFNDVINTLYHINLKETLTYNPKKHPSIQELWGIKTNNPTTLFINSLIRSNDLTLAKKIYADFKISHSQVLSIIETLFFKIQLESYKPTLLINDTFNQLQQVITDKNVPNELNQILTHYLEIPSLGKDIKIINYNKEKVILWIANNPSNTILENLDNKSKKEMITILSKSINSFTKSEYNINDTNKATLFKTLVFQSNDWINSACLQNTYPKAIKSLIQYFRIQEYTHDALYQSKEFLADYEKNKMRHDMISPRNIEAIKKAEEIVPSARKNRI